MRIHHQWKFTTNSNTTCAIGKLWQLWCSTSSIESTKFLPQKLYCFKKIQNKNVIECGCAWWHYTICDSFNIPIATFVQCFTRISSIYIRCMPLLASKSNWQKSEVSGYHFIVAGPRFSYRVTAVPIFVIIIFTLNKNHPWTKFSTNHSNNKLQCWHVGFCLHFQCTKRNNESITYEANESRFTFSRYPTPVRTNCRSNSSSNFSNISLFHIFQTFKSKNLVLMWSFTWKKYFKHYFP